MLILLSGIVCMFTLTVVVTVMVIVALYQKYTNHSLFVNIVYVFNFFFF